MATILNLSKAKEVIRLDDEPGSPSFVLDLTDNAVIKNGQEVYQEYIKHNEQLTKIEQGSDTPEDRALMAKIWKKTISVLLGENAYDIICDYVRNGFDDVTDDEITLLLTPVVLYLLDKLNSVATANNNQAVLKYARSKQSAANSAI